jgi:hypothetical protein
MTMARENMLKNAAELQKLCITELRKRFLSLFGEASTSRNKVYLVKRIVYGQQERKHGGLSDKARKRAAELAENAPIRRRLAPDTLPIKEAEPSPPRDPRLPVAGTLLRRTYHGLEHVVTVLDVGFLYNGTKYGSLSAIAREITGTRWNGFGFFGLLEKDSE